MARIKTKSGNTLAYNIDKWTISENRNCKIINEDDEFLTLENKSHDRVRLSKSLISDNNIEIIDNTVELSKYLYEYHFLNAIKERELNRMNDLFNENIELIFKHREIVLSKAEYYLIQPAMLQSGDVYDTSSKYSLGAFIESFNRSNPFFFEELSGHKNLYLVHLSGSSSSGEWTGSFWSSEENKIIRLDRHEMNYLLDKMFFMRLKSNIKKAVGDSYFRLDYQARAIEGLISEIGELGGGEEV